MAEVALMMSEVNKGEQWTANKFEINLRNTH